MCGLGVSLHVSPLRESSLFPAVLWISRILALLVSKARCLGLISPAQVPRLGLGVPEVGHQPFASRDKLCICETPPNCVSPHQVCIFWWEHISVSPFYIDLFILHHWRVVYLVLRLFFSEGNISCTCVCAQLPQSCMIPSSAALHAKFLTTEPLGKPQLFHM